MSMRFLEPDPYDYYRPRTPYISPVRELEEALDFAKRLEVDRKQKEEQEKKKQTPKYFPWAYKQISTGKMLLILIATAPFTGMLVSWFALEMYASWKIRMLTLLKTLG